jgi:hypothetical protein
MATKEDTSEPGWVAAANMPPEFVVVGRWHTRDDRRLLNTGVVWVAYGDLGGGSVRSRPLAPKQIRRGQPGWLGQLPN